MLRAHGSRHKQCQTIYPRRISRGRNIFLPEPRHVKSTDSELRARSRSLFKIIFFSALTTPLTSQLAGVKSAARMIVGPQTTSEWDPLATNRGVAAGV